MIYIHSFIYYISTLTEINFSSLAEVDLRRLAPMAAAAALLGDDGRGYELARRLESSGTWRAWLGDSGYAAFAHALASPSAWESFMSSRSQAHLHLQLRARALLFDKASSSLFSPSPSTASSSLSNLNPSCESQFFSRFHSI